MKTQNTEIEGKVQLNLTLDAEIAEWLKEEANDNNMTIDEMVESLVHTLRALDQLKDETMGAAFSMLSDDGKTELPS